MMLQRHACVGLNRWVFRGPPLFLQAVEQAADRIRAEDPELLEAMRSDMTVVLSPTSVFVFPFWKYAGISQECLERGTGGVVAALVFIHYRSNTAQLGRWTMSVPETSIAEAQSADDVTREWLEKHGWTAEIVLIFNQHRAKAERASL